MSTENAVFLAEQLGRGEKPCQLAAWVYVFKDRRGHIERTPVTLYIYLESGGMLMLPFAGPNACETFVDSRPELKPLPKIHWMKYGGGGWDDIARGALTGGVRR